MTIRFDFPIEAFQRASSAARQQMAQQTPDLMQAMGIQLLSFAQLAYRDKARGGQGDDGVKWAPLQRGTLEARVRRRAKARAIVKERRDIAGQIRTTRGAGAPSKIRKLRDRRKKLSARLQKEVDKEVANHEIGVDTGLQRASAQPGYTGADGKGGNLLDVSGAQVTVGYARSYSQHFDTARPLLPATMPEKWQKTLDGLVQDWAETIIQESLP